MQAYFKLNLGFFCETSAEMHFPEIGWFVCCYEHKSYFQFPSTPVSSALMASLSLPLLSSILRMWAINYNEPIQDSTGAAGKTYCCLQTVLKYCYNYGSKTSNLNEGRNSSYLIFHSLPMLMVQSNLLSSFFPYLVCCKKI